MIIVILVGALILRLININQSLWWDEAINVVYAQTFDFWGFVTQYPITDFHPPGYFAILWVFGHLFGFSEVSVRLPSILFGVLTVYFTYLIGRELISRKVGLISALLMALAPLHIYYSQEARMYAFAAFAATLSFYFLIRLLRGFRFAGLGYAFSVLLVLYSDYVTYFVIPAQILYVLVFYKKRTKRFLISLVLGLLSIVPWLLIFPQQLQTGRLTSVSITGWASIVGGANIKNALLLPVKTIVGKVTFDNKLLYGFFMVISAAPYFFIFTKFKKIYNISTQLLLCWLLISTMSSFLISFFVPVFAYFRLLFILPAFYLLTATLLETFRGNTFRIVVSSIIFIEVLLGLLYILNPKFQREDWRGAINFINQNYSDQSVVLFENAEIIAPFRYYRNNLVNAVGGLKTIPAYNEYNLVNLEEILQGKSKVYLFEYLVDVTDKQRILEQKLLSLGFTNSQIYDFNGVGFVKLYER